MGNKQWLIASCQTHISCECKATTKAQTGAATKTRIYYTFGWTNNGERVQHIHQIGGVIWTYTQIELLFFFFLSGWMCMSWMLKTGWYKLCETRLGGCVYFLHVWMWSRYSVKRMKNGQEYCSMLRVQFSMNQKQLSWLLFHTLLSARKWDFFFFCKNFLQVKSLQNGIKWGIFSLSNVKALEVWGRLAGKRRKVDFVDSRGGLPYICPSTKPLLDPLLN